MHSRSVELWGYSQAIVRVILGKRVFEGGVIFSSFQKPNTKVSYYCGYHCVSSLISGLILLNISISSSLSFQVTFLSNFPLVCAAT